MKQISIIFLLIFITTNSYSNLKDISFESIHKNLSIGIDLSGHFQTFNMRNYDEKAEDTFYNILALNAFLSKGAKISWKYLYAHYQYDDYFNNDEDTKILNKILLTINQKTPISLFSSINFKAGYIDDLTFCHGLTLDSYYHFGYQLSGSNKSFSLSTAFFSSGIYINDIFLSHLKLYNILGFSYMFIKDYYEDFEHLPGIDLTLNLFDSKVKFYGEGRINSISKSHHRNPGDIDIQDKLAYLYGMKINLKDNDDYLLIDIKSRYYSKYFNYVYSGHNLDIFKYRFPEVQDTRYDNWFHYLIYRSDVKGFSISLQSRKNINSNFYIDADYEYVNLDWDDFDGIEKHFYDLSINYQYSKEIDISLGATNKFIVLFDQHNIIFYQGFRKQVPLFNDTENCHIRLKLEYNF